MKKDDLGSELARTDIANSLDKMLDHILNTIFKDDLNEMRKSIFSHQAYQALKPERNTETCHYQDLT